jgi:formylglycine-generating enzyme required for sulfatase activity
MGFRKRAMAVAAGVLLVWGLGVAAGGTINMDWVPVGNPGNAPDTRYYGISVGGVASNYNIGKYEVTNNQYVVFLNSVDALGTNPYALYNGNMGSSYYGGISFNGGAPNGAKYAARPGRGQMPVNYVCFWDACRFANWMNNGQGTGDTETGAYSLNGITNPPNGSISRNPGANVFIPSEDEWYKAAYYKGGGINAGYWDYPTRSNTAPTAEGPPGTDLVNGSANYNFAVEDLTNVGSYTSKPSASPYGTFDQGGNVWEWNETTMIGSARGLRGGSFGDNGDGLRASSRGYGPPTDEADYLGFRVSEVPEPGTMALLAFGGIGMLVRRRGLGR